MGAEIGYFSLILAFAVAVLQSVLPLIGAWRRIGPLIAFADSAALMLLFFVGLAFALLMHGFAVSDFSMLVVASHSNSTMPLPYRLAATWGNHEGSLVLWVLILAVFGAAVAALAQLPPTLKARVLAVQGMIAAAFIGLSLFTSNPFERLVHPPVDGMELNPLLQDIGLILHPPFLYLGYVGVSSAFSFAVAALIEGRVDAAWARQVRPWVLAAWIFLTIGITLGSYWAYYELGWGGWWFWDPVENASFMPWLVTTALLHSAIVVERRQTLIVWTLLLAILAFSLSLVGTFVVRSGIITSVHAFATDPARGIWILCIMVFFTGGALTLFSMRAHKFASDVSFRPVSREGGLILNNIILVTATATVFLGTFYPLVVEVLGPEKISVGAPFFNRTFVPMMVPLFLALSVGALLRWKRDTLKESILRLKWVAAAVLVLVAVAAVIAPGQLVAVMALGLAAWMVLGALAVLAARFRLRQGDLRRSWELARSTPRAVYGMVMAHAGLGLLVVGITCVTAWQEEAIVSIPVGGSVEAGNYTFVLEDVQIGTGPNFQRQSATLTASRLGGTPISLVTERRFYPVSENVTTEAAIAAVGLTNLYVSLGGPGGAADWVVRVHYHPFVLLIWFGPALMALGGLISLTDRRMRIGVLGARAAPPGAAA